MQSGRWASYCNVSGDNYGKRIIINADDTSYPLRVGGTGNYSTNDNDTFKVAWDGALTIATNAFKVDAQGNLSIAGSAFNVSADGKLWSGAAAFTNAPFSVSEKGVMKATSGSIA
mgnify:CR=1 FL=1